MQIFLIVFLGAGLGGAMRHGVNVRERFPTLEALPDNGQSWRVHNILYLLA